GSAAASVPAVAGTETHARGGSASRGPLKGVKTRSLQVFSRQFATMINAGLNVVTSLATLEDQTSGVQLSQVVGEVRADVERGALLSEALARHPKVFSRIYISMVEAGEAAGILDNVLDRLATQIEKEANLKRRVKGAMVYPTLVVSFAFLVLCGMLLFIVPIFEKLYKQLGGHLPMLTQYIIKASDIMRADWFIVFPVIGGTIFAFFKWKKSEEGRKHWDRFKLRIPMKIGDIVLKVTMARFSRTLSTLVAAGVDIIKALEITAQTSGNWVVEEALTDVKAKVHEGVPIAVPLTENPVFPPMV